LYEGNVIVVKTPVRLRPGPKHHAHCGDVFRIGAWNGIDWLWKGTGQCVRWPT